MRKKALTSGQEQWRLGYIAGIKNERMKIDDLEDEIAELKVAHLLLRIMQDMGIADRESAHYWPGMEQALAIYSDLINNPNMRAA